MNEHASYIHTDYLPELTIELNKDQPIVVSPHNTTLFEFTGESSSRSYIYLYTVTDNLEIPSIRLFKTFYPEIYSEVRQRIIDNDDYWINLEQTHTDDDELAYQQEIYRHTESWRQKIPDTVMDFLITTALK